MDKAFLRLCAIMLSMLFLTACAAGTGQEAAEPLIQTQTIEQPENTSGETLPPESGAGEVVPEESQTEEKVSYVAVYPATEGLLCVYADGKFGYVRQDDGTQAIPFKYDMAAPFSEGLAYFARDGVYGFLNGMGEELLLPKCDSVSSFSEGRAYYSIDGKYGYFDETGRKVIPPLYDDAGFFTNGVAIVRIGGECGVIDRAGRQITPMQPEAIMLQEHWILVGRGSGRQYYDLQGRPITQAQVESLDAQADLKKADETETEHTEWETDGAEGRAFLCNNITTAMPAFYQLAREILIEAAVNDGRYWNGFARHTFILYRITGSNTPVLYYYAEPAVIEPYAFELSKSAFYVVEDAEAKCLASVACCGGSGGGNTMMPAYDTISGELLISEYMKAGGFGGYARGITIYDYRDEELTERIEYRFDTQSTENYTQEELLRKPELFYDDFGSPYTEEGIVEAERVTAYYIGDERVPAEKYMPLLERYKDRWMVYRDVLEP